MLSCVVQDGVDVLLRVQKHVHEPCALLLGDLVDTVNQRLNRRTVSQFFEPWEVILRGMNPESPGDSFIDPKGHSKSTLAHYSWLLFPC